MIQGSQITGPHVGQCMVDMDVVAPNNTNKEQWKRILNNRYSEASSQYMRAHLQQKRLCVSRYKE